MRILGFYNSVLTMKIANPCNERGEFILPHTRPQVPLNEAAATNPWDPFNSRIEFDFAHYHFVEAQSSASLIDKALNMWAATVIESDEDAPWKHSKELYATIDNIQHSDTPWKVYKLRYQGLLPQGTPPKWMTQTYELCARDA